MAHPIVWFELASRASRGQVDKKVKPARTGLDTIGRGTRRGRRCRDEHAMRNKNVLASRVKRVMQGDEDVGKIAHASPVLIGARTRANDGGSPTGRNGTRTLWFVLGKATRAGRRCRSKEAADTCVSLSAKALELFLKDLCHKVAETTTERGARTISPGHLKQCILKHEKFDFLKDVVAKVPDLPPMSKRRRTRDEDGDFKPKKDRKATQSRAQPKRRVKREHTVALAELSTESSGEERVVDKTEKGREQDAGGLKDLAMEFPSGKHVGGLDLESVPQGAALVIPEVAPPPCIGDEEDDYD